MIAKFAADLKKESVLAKDFFTAELRQGWLFWEPLRPKRAGEIVQRPVLAKTLQAIAHGHRKAFYQGWIAEAMVKHLQAKGGLLSLTDLQSYRPVKREPLRFTLGPFTLLTVGVPACGAVIIHALGVLEQTLKRASDEYSTWHAMIEALKYAYGGRMSLGDGKHETESILVDPNVIIKHARSIDWEKTHEPVHYLRDYPKAFDPDHSLGTTHVSIIDEAGTAVSCTDTVNLEWGARIADPVSGVLLNNEMGDFSTLHQPNHYGLPGSNSNRPFPGHRPMSTSVPMIILKDEKPFIIIGAAGGSRMASVITQLLMHLIIQNHKPGQLYDLIMEGRLHHQLIPNQIVAEHRTDRKLLAALVKRGHKVSILPKGLYLTSVQIIVRDEAEGGWRALSDPRKGGYSAGY